MESKQTHSGVTAKYWTWAFTTYWIFGLKVDLERFEERIDNIIKTWETIKTTAGDDDKSITWSCKQRV